MHFTFQLKSSVARNVKCEGGARTFDAKNHNLEKTGIIRKNRSNQKKII
jgi:hypothetical protein